MLGKRLLHALSAILLSVVLTPVGAASFDIGTTSVTIPAPAGFVGVTPKMRQLWQLVQAAQGDNNHIVAFYIPETEETAALRSREVNLSRNINVQVRRSLQGTTLTEADFQHVKKQIEALISTRQVSDIQAKALEQLSGNLQKATGANFTLSQTKNLTLPPHINRPGYFAYSEISTEKVAMPDGATQQVEVTATAAAILVKGKLLVCHVTGSKGDLKWTRLVAKQWAESIVSSNSP